MIILTEQDIQLQNYTDIINDSFDEDPYRQDKLKKLMAGIEKIKIIHFQNNRRTNEIFMGWKR